MQLGPDEARGEVDRGVLPDPPSRARQPADVEAVEADELARRSSPMWRAGDGSGRSGSGSWNGWGYSEGIDVAGGNVKGHME